MFKKLPPLKYLYEVFDYDIASGKLYRKKKTTNSVIIGSEAGGVNGRGYRTVSINNYRYPIHRVIYYMHHGTIDNTKDVDHIDRNRLNNHISNLRLVSRGGNNYNHPKRKDNTSGVVGVCWNKQKNKWLARMGKKCLGNFSNIEDAVAARRQAEKML